MGDPRPPMQIRPAEREDLGHLAQLHMTNLGGDLVALGESVIRAFYRNGMQRGVLRVYLGYEGKQAVAMAVLTGVEHAVFRRSLLDSPRDAASLLWSARKWPLLKTLMRKLKGGDEGADDGYGLLYLAVDSHLRGGGRGRQLLDAVEADLRQMGEPAYHLQVKCSNVGGINFYLSNGFRRGRHAAARDLLVLHKSLAYTGSDDEVGSNGLMGDQ